MYSRSRDGNGYTSFLALRKNCLFCYLKTLQQLLNISTKVEMVVISFFLYIACDLQSVNPSGELLNFFVTVTKLNRLNCEYLLIELSFCHLCKCP